MRVRRVRGYRGRRFGAVGVLTVGAGTSFSPLDLSPFVWLKADAGTFQTDGGSAATADTDPVGQLRDQSGNGRHVTAAGGARPLLKLNIQNGLPVVRFDGTDDLMTSAAFTLNQPFYYAAAFKVRAGGSLQIVWDSLGADSQSVGYVDAAGDFNIYAVNDVVTLGAVGTAFHVVTATYNGASSSGRVDGGVAATGNAGAGVPGGLTLGRRGLTASEYAHLDLGEFVALSAAPTAGQDAQLRAYLKARWSTP